MFMFGLSHWLPSLVRVCSWWEGRGHEGVVLPKFIFLLWFISTGLFWLFRYPMTNIYNPIYILRLSWSAHFSSLYPCTIYIYKSICKPALDYIPASAYGHICHQISDQLSTYAVAGAWLRWGGGLNRQVTCNDSHLCLISTSLLIWVTLCFQWLP